MKDREQMIRWIADRVHHEYYTYDTNCATVTLLCLSHIYDIPLGEQLLHAATGMHGAGGYRAQCGLVEGSLMFLGILGREKGMSKEEIVALCYRYGESFETRFGSLTCRGLRPGGFRVDDPPHLCETLTNRSILFTFDFIEGAL